MAANIYQAVKEAMQDLVAPQFESLKGELGAVRLDIRRVEEKLTNEIQRVDEKLSTEIRGIDNKLTWALDLRADHRARDEARRAGQRLVTPS